LCNIQPQSGYYLAEQLRQVIGAVITIQGDVHEVFLFFHQPHPLVDYKIHFTLNNVDDLLPVPYVQGAQYPTPISPVGSQLLVLAHETFYTAWGHL